MIKTFSSLILITFFLTMFPVFSDTVTLNNGDEVFGTITKITKTKVSLKDQKGKFHSYNKKGLLKIVFSGFIKIKGENKVSDIKNKELRSLLKENITAKQYPNAGHVTLIDETRVKYFKDKTSKITFHSAFKILKERSRDLANVGFYYKNGYETAKIDFARTINKNKIYYLKEESVQDESVNYSLKEYEKLMKRKFAIPKASLGSVIEYSYTKFKKNANILEPVFGEFIFKGRNPIKIAKLIIEVPKRLKFKYEIRNNKDNIIKFSKREKGNNIIYKFYAKNIAGYRSEDQMPPSNLIFPYVMYGIDHGFKNVSYKLSKKLKERFSKDADIVNKVNEICKDCKTNKEKARKIYNYVAKEISLKNVSMYSYLYFPKNADKIYHNKFASKLDKTFIYYNMLKIAGINSEFCYVRSKLTGPIAKIGNIAQFSTVCLYIPEFDQYVNLSGDTVSFDQLLDSYQGSYIFNIAENKLSKIKYKKPQYSSSIYLYNINLFKNGDINVSKTEKYTGNNTYGIRSKKSMSKKEIDSSVEQIISSIHPNAKLKKYEYKNINSLDKDPEFLCDYFIKDYALKASNKYLVFKIPQNSYSAYSVGNTKRDFPLYWSSKGYYRTKAEITIPKGYRLYYLPSSFERKVGKISYKVNFSSLKNKIIFNEEFIRNGNTISSIDYKYYKELIERRAKMSDEWIVIKKK